MTKSLPAGIYVENYLVRRLAHQGEEKTVRSTVTTTAIVGLEAALALVVILVVGIPGVPWVPSLFGNSGRTSLTTSIVAVVCFGVLRSEIGATPEGWSRKQTNDEMLLVG